MENSILLHPEEITACLFHQLPKRTKDILEQRFGLGKNREPQTLEAIGRKYGITRERVRQIEANGFHRVQKSPEMDLAKNTFLTLENYFLQKGGVIQENHILESLAPHPKHKNHVYFLLTLHKPFLRLSEDHVFRDRWVFGESAADHAHKTVRRAVEELRKVTQPVSEEKLYEILSSSAHAELGKPVAAGVLEQWLGISKLISRNYFGEWGLADSPAIKPRGVRDLSHMVMSKHGKPMHFSEVAQAISILVGKPVHVQTVHNELIKDDRFVLVGRGLYALKDWGYTTGTVKDVIASVLKNEGPLSKEKVLALVAEKRLVKPNTVLINLNNKRYFKKLPDGRYCTF